ncbi:MAG TPA: hypothetical protein VFZ59_11855 [Verrucomicrobiae bacterium]|nr:hypothetical protein [Verrucomicrobiae bacterium]
MAHLRVLASRHEFPSGLLVDTAQLLKEDRAGGTIEIKYDPKLPERAWASDVGWADENGLFWFSLSALFFQAVGALLLTLFLVPGLRSNYWPWWWEVHKFLPLAAESFCMLLMGLIDRFMDSIS